ncbi:MAG TPA: hypothetical protein VF898_11050 [Chloroflexota bacterium]
MTTVALTGSFFTLLSGDAAQKVRLSENDSLTRGFVGAVVVLAAAALCAAFLAALRGTARRPSEA